MLWKVQDVSILIPRNSDERLTHAAESIDVNNLCYWLCSRRCMAPDVMLQPKVHSILVRRSWWNRHGMFI